MTRPMTTGELFSKIQDILKEKGRLPDILDYGLPTGTPVPVTTCEFDLKSNLAYGGSEGIYLGLWIECFVDDERRLNELGTFKTLDDDSGAMHTMAGLLADFILETHAYLNAHMDDFTWEGVDVYPYDDAGKRLNWRYSCPTMEAALKRKDELLEKHSQVAVRDNATRKEKIYAREGMQGW